MTLLLDFNSITQRHFLLSLKSWYVEDRSLKLNYTVLMSKETRFSPQVGRYTMAKLYNGIFIAIKITI